MAYIGTPQFGPLAEQNDKNKKELTKQSGFAVPTSGPAAAGDAPKVESGKGSGTGWVNLSTYLAANAGEGQRMGNEIYNYNLPIYNTTSQATKDWESGQLKDIEEGTNINPMTANTVNNPDSPVSTYDGPEEVAKLTDEITQGQADLDKIASLTESFDGRKTLAGDAYKRQDYTPAMRGLDAFLVGASEGGMQSMNDIKGLADTNRTETDNATGRISGAISGAKTRVADANKNPVTAAARDPFGAQVANPQLPQYGTVDGTFKAAALGRIAGSPVPAPEEKKPKLAQGHNDGVMGGLEQLGKQNIKSPIIRNPLIKKWRF